MGRERARVQVMGLGFVAVTGLGRIERSLRRAAADSLGSGSVPGLDHPAAVRHRLAARVQRSWIEVAP